MSAARGRFVWYELMTSDLEGAKVFYKAVMGWESEDVPVTNGIPYTAISIDGEDVAGLMGFRPDMPKDTKPQWYGYIDVDNCDAAVDQAKALGGQLRVPAKDIPNVGRDAMVADPQGPVVWVLTPPADQEEETITASPLTGWHELVTTDQDKAFEFYNKMFGWEKSTAMDMGAMGTYQMFTQPGSDAAIGGVMNRPKDMPTAPYWTYYFNVPSIEAAIGRINAGKGKVIHGPTQVPGGQWTVQALDPQGAMFSLLGAK